MKLILIALLSISNLYAVEDIDQIDLQSIGPHIDGESVLVESNELYQIRLTNKECFDNFEDADFIIPSKEKLKSALELVKKNISKDIHKMIDLTKSLDANVYKSVESTLFPITINLNINGFEQCRNAAAGYNNITLPLPHNLKEYNYMIEFFSHEFGHYYQNRLSSHNNAFSEATADMFALLYNPKLSGISHVGDDFLTMYYEEQERIEQFNNLGLQSLLELYPGATEEGLLLSIDQYKNVGCISENYMRDFSILRPLRGSYLEGNEVYAFSCWLNSAIKSVSPSDYLKNIRSFLSFYLKNPDFFNGHDVQAISKTALPALSSIMNNEIVRDNKNHIEIERVQITDEYNNISDYILYHSELDFNMYPAFVTLRTKDRSLLSFTYVSYPDDESDYPVNSILRIDKSEDGMSRSVCFEESTEIFLEISNHAKSDQKMIKYPNTNSLTLEKGCYGFMGM